MFTGLIHFISLHNGRVPSAVRHLGHNHNAPEPTPRCAPLPHMNLNLTRQLLL
jgi:hypothetical protein